MGIRRTGKDVEFSKVTASVPHVSNGLKYWNFFDKAGTLARNLAPGGGAPRLNGLPKQNAGYVSFLNQMNVDTGVAETGELTFLIACQLATLTSSLPGAMGTYSAGGSSQIHFDPASGKVIQYDSRINDDTFIANANTLVKSPYAWSFYSARYGAAISKIMDHTKSLTAFGSATYPRLVSGLNVRIGYTENRIDTNVNVAFAAIFNRALTDAECVSIYDVVKVYLASFGLRI